MRRRPSSSVSARAYAKCPSRPRLPSRPGQLGGNDSSCAYQAYGWSGGGSGYKTDVWVNDNGSRVAVLLLNARPYDTAQPATDQAAHTALTRLCCGA